MSEKNEFVNPLKVIFQKIIWFCHYFSWLARYLRLVTGLNALCDIKILSIEFSSVCNLRCRSWQPKEWNESFHKSAEGLSPAKGFCTFVFNNVSLSVSGFVSKCCMDLKGSTDYADLRSNTLENIWHSQARKQFLSLMFQNKRQSLSGCSSYSITHTDNNNRYSNIFRTIQRKYLMSFKRSQMLAGFVNK